MVGYGTESRHFWLSLGMARRAGVAPEALDLTAVVTRCTACPHPEACAAWQAEHDEGQHAPPSYCLNKAAFEAAE